RRLVKEWVERGDVPATSSVVTGDALLDVVMQVSRGHDDLSDDTSLEALGLSSLEHVELLMALEQRFETTIDEMAFGAARTIGDLRTLLGREGPPGRPSENRPAEGGSAFAQDASADTSGRRGQDGSALARGATDKSGTRQALAFPRWNRARWAYWLR